MGNSGSYGLQVDVQRVAVNNKENSRALANKNSKVIDSYSFGVSQSCTVRLTLAYLNFAEGSRIKISDQLNHTRINLLKIAFVKDSVQISEPEMNLLSFFQPKSSDQKRYSKVYNVVSSSSPVD